MRAHAEERMCHRAHLGDGLAAKGGRLEAREAGHRHRARMAGGLTPAPFAALVAGAAAALRPTETGAASS
jgi:hypothetical protein